MKTAAAQNNFRAQFAREFGELAQALPYRLVIVIDDLDRCLPAAVLDVMEAVNYLTSAGECFVIFGMAPERVKAALGLAFKDIAAEMVEMTPGDTNQPHADAAQAKRRAYADDYLQKLVNIEIRVPTQQDMAAHRLLVRPGPAPRRRLLGVLAEIWRLWPLAAGAVAVCAGVWVATALSTKPADKPPPVAAAAPVDAKLDAQSKLEATPPAKPPSEAERSSGPTGSSLAVEPGESFGLASIALWLALALVPLLAGGLAIAWRLLRTTIQETTDSDRFREALEIWAPVVAMKRGTPRAIKRFGNRIRYLAMLQQGEAKDETPLDLVLARLRQWRGSDSTVDAAPPPQGVLAEHQLIAMGAVHEVVGERWREALAAGGPSHLEAIAEKYADDDDDACSRDPEWRIDEAKDSHINKFNVRWPPSDEELQVFERLLSGVRLAGDPQVIRPDARPDSKKRK